MSRPFPAPSHRSAAIAWLLALCAGCGGAPAPTEAAPEAPRATLTYRVEPSADLRRAEITACESVDSEFFPWGFRANHATLLVGTRAANQRGSAPEMWRPDANGCVRYRVSLGTASRIGSAALLTGHSPLLVRPRGRFRPAEIRFVLPAGLDVATAWPRLAGIEDAYRIPAQGFGHDSDIVIGRFEGVRREVSGAEIRYIDTTNALPFPDGMVADHIARAAELVATVGGTFPMRNVLAVALPTPSSTAVTSGRTKRGGGGSILIRMGIFAPPTREALQRDWVTVHELCHLLHPRLRDEDRWISEGLATYYQEVLRARGGWLGAEEAWDRIADGFARGRPDGTRRTLSEEARDMRRTGAYLRVYWAGTAFALEADMHLRRRGRSLDEALAGARRSARIGARVVNGMDFIRALDPSLAELGERYARLRSFPDTDALMRELAQDRELRDAIMRAPTSGERR